MPRKKRTPVVEGRPYRWNSDESVWQFFEESWGGWCVLRMEPGETSRPMTRDEGERYLAMLPSRLGAGAYHVVTYEATKGQPARAE